MCKIAVSYVRLRKVRTKKEALKQLRKMYGRHVTKDDLEYYHEGKYKPTSWWWWDGEVKHLPKGVKPSVIKPILIDTHGGIEAAEIPGWRKGNLAYVFADMYYNYC